jgi:Ecdysteroid kinase-like family
MTELSEKECQSIVKKASTQEDVVIVKFSLDSFGNYLGFLGEYYRLKIDATVNTEDKSFNFFVKSLPNINLKQRKMLIETGIFLKEVKLYRNLLSRFVSNSKEEKCSLPVPAMFHSREDLLVLEDLSQTGYKILPDKIEFKRAHVEVTLSSLAVFHSQSIAYENIHGRSLKEEFGDILFETSVDDISWFHAGLQVSRSFASQTRV